MSLAKEKVDLVGSESAGVVTFVSVAGAGVYPAVLTRRDVTGKVGLAFIFRVKYTTAPGTRPKLEIFTSMIDSANLQDTEPYETVEVDTGTSVEKQVTIPIRFVEDIRYISWKITNGTTNSAEFYLGLVETNL